MSAWHSARQVSGGNVGVAASQAAIITLKSAVLIRGINGAFDSFSASEKLAAGVVGAIADVTGALTQMSADPGGVVGNSFAIDQIMTAVGGLISVAEAQLPGGQPGGVGGRRRPRQRAGRPRPPQGRVLRPGGRPQRAGDRRRGQEREPVRAGRGRLPRHDRPVREGIGGDPARARRLRRPAAPAADRHPQAAQARGANLGGPQRHRRPRRLRARQPRAAGNTAGLHHPLREQAGRQPAGARRHRHARARCRRRHGELRSRRLRLRGPPRRGARVAADVPHTDRRSRRERPRRRRGRPARRGDADRQLDVDVGRSRDGRRSR